MMKIYRNHNGVTKKLGTMNAGSELIILDVFGTIRFKEKGVFIAAESGITPFISIFRDLNQKQLLEGNSLIYTNKTSEDVILKKELNEIHK